MNRIITLTTDFGSSDGFVGTMKGVILNINPQASIVDITHDIAPQNIEQGAFLFANACGFFPANTIHVVVVDPGVGTSRRPIAMQIGETFFVAPDNGVIAPAMTNYPLPFRVVHLNRPQFFLPRVSHTFHGRDIFAPVAAHLSLGVPLDALGDAIDDWTQLDIAMATRDTDGAIVGKVVHIDRFGNLITNIPGGILGGLTRVHLAGRVLIGIRQTYAEAALGEPLALVSSSGTLEIAVRNGNAAVAFGIEIGTTVRVTS
ncbi:MAG: SAM-dependent chlorinase/fluorinase [Chloroflexi bacterium]|nr:SAM-dependent chlorinase/fluorinase [Chloroflexota bacterium]